MRCRDCQYIEYEDYQDICVFKDEVIRYDDYICEHFVMKG